MKRTMAALAVGMLVAASGAWAQSPAPAGETSKDKGAAAAYQNPAAEQTQAQKAKEGMDAAAKSNVDASKKTARQKPKNVKDMTPEERAAWQKQMKEQSKP